MPAASPPAPTYRVPDTTDAARRLAVLERHADAARQTPAVRDFAARVARRAGARADGAAGAGARAAAALDAVQRLPYRPDPPGEWYQPAAYTAAAGGDCEDLAVLFVAVARLLGLPAALVWVTQPGQRLNHVTARVRVGGRDLWADPSVRGARLGESPYDAIRRLGAWYVLGVGAREAGGT